MKNPTNNQVRFEVTEYDGQTIETKYMSRQELASLGLHSRDCCLANCIGVEGYKDREGRWHDFDDQQKGIGHDVCRKILENIQFNPGIALDKDMLVSLTGHPQLTRKGILPPRIHALRKAFGESKESQYFIHTSKKSPLKVMWPKERTWIWVVPVLP
jgi:hypothetical protein